MVAAKEIPIGYLFRGQGAQYIGMGKDVYEKYAEAREVFENSPATWWQYPKGLEHVIKEEREDRRVIISWESKIEQWLDKEEKDQVKKDSVLLTDVMERCLRIAPEDWPRHQKKAGAAMSAIGWKPRRLRKEDGTRPRVYVRLPLKNEGQEGEGD